MRRRLAALLLAAALLLCGCGAAERPADAPTMQLYGLSGVPGGDAIAAVEVDWTDCTELDTQRQAEVLLLQLLGGCADPVYRSPVPSGVQLHSCLVEGSAAQVDLSAAYGQLSGIDLTIADYCIALTLTQLSGVSVVRVTVDGRELAYRDHQLLLAREVLMTSEEDVVRTLAVRLYFPAKSMGQLAPEARMLTLYEGESAAGAIMEELLGGPETESLLPLLPEGFQVLTVRVESGTCMLNLPRSNELLLPKSAEEQQMLVQGIVNSLCSAKGISDVQLLLDGELSATFGSVDISQPLRAVHG